MPTLNKHSIAQRFCPILAEPRNAKSRVFAGKTQPYVAERRGCCNLRNRRLQVRVLSGVFFISLAES